MPFYLNELDVVAEARGSRSALIVSCYMCPAVTVASREKRPFIRLFSDFVKSAPFEEYIQALQAGLGAEGVDTTVYRSMFYCMWPSGRRKKLETRAKQHDAVIVLGCDSATETVRDSVGSTDCKVIKGMEVAGITNARMRFQWPCNISLEDCTITAIVQQKGDRGVSD